MLPINVEREIEVCYHPGGSFNYWLSRFISHIKTPAVKKFISHMQNLHEYNPEKQVIFIGDFPR